MFQKVSLERLDILLDIPLYGNRVFDIKINQNCFMCTIKFIKAKIRTDSTTFVL